MGCGWWLDGIERGERHRHRPGRRVEAVAAIFQRRRGLDPGLVGPDGEALDPAAGVGRLDPVDRGA